MQLLPTRRAPRTVDAYRRDLAQLSAWRQGPFAETTTEELERWLAELRAAGLAASTVARRIAASALLLPAPDAARARDDNPAAALQLPVAPGRCRARSRPPKPSA